jgi:hypothetical protein
MVPAVMKAPASFGVSANFQRCSRYTRRHFGKRESALLITPPENYTITSAARLRELAPVLSGAGFTDTILSYGIYYVTAY